MTAPYVFETPVASSRSSVAARVIVLLDGWIVTRGTPAMPASLAAKTTVGLGALAGRRDRVRVVRRPALDREAERPERIHPRDGLPGLQLGLAGVRRVVDRNRIEQHGVRPARVRIGRD